MARSSAEVGGGELAQAARETGAKAALGVVLTVQEGSQSFLHRRPDAEGPLTGAN